MTSFNKKFSSVIIVALTLVAFVIIKETLQSSSTQKTIQIGMVYSLTGPASIWAENAKNAAKMAADEINSTGGVNGKKLNLVFQDGGSDPSKSVLAFQNLHNAEGIDIIVGDMWSVVTNPLIPLADSSKTLLISPTVMDASVEGSSSYFFTVGHMVESQETAVRKFFAENPEIKTVYDLCWNDAWGKAHTVLIHRIVSELGLKLIGETCTNDYSSDYRTEAAKIKAANPDAIFLAGAYEDVAIKALSNLNVRAKILTTNGIVEAVEARDFPLDYTKNVWFMDWTPNQDFIQRFQKEFGSYPIMEAQNSYEAVRSVAQAIKNDPNDILSGLKSVKYGTVDGQIDFTGASNISVNKAEAKLYTFNSDKSFNEVY